MYIENGDHTVKIDSTELSASFGLGIHKTARQLLNEVKGGELKWNYEKGKSIHDLNSLSIKQVLNAHTAKIEELTNALAREELKSTILLIAFVSLVLFLIFSKLFSK